MAFESAISYLTIENTRNRRTGERLRSDSQGSTTMLEVHEKRETYVKGSYYNGPESRFWWTNYLYTPLDATTSAERGYTTCGKGSDWQDSVLHVMGFIDKTKKNQ